MNKFTPFITAISVTLLMLLDLTLRAEAKNSPKESTRVVYAWGDNMVEIILPEPGVINNASNLTSRLFILSVGIGNYDNPQLKDLSYPTNDAQDVYKVLDSLKRLNSHIYTKEVIGVGEKYLLLNEEATRENILNCMQDISDAVNPQDVVMIYLAGHGKRIANRGTYFLPYGMVDVGHPNTYAIKYKHITDQLKELVDKECIPILFVDACHAGDFYERSAVDFVGNADPSIIGFYSSTGTQRSVELPQLEHGLFTDALLKGLRGGAVNEQGNITIRSLADYIRDEMRANAKKYLYGSVQTPKLDNRGEDHYVLFGNSDGSQPVSTKNKKQYVSTVGKMEEPFYSRNNVVESRRYMSNTVMEKAEGFYSGTLQPKTTEEAFNAYLDAAKGNSAKFMYKVGECYAEGYGCSQNFEEAFSWYKKAAEEGLDSAQHEVGKMYYEGKGVSHDIQMAKKWLREAAIKENVKSQSDLGELLYESKEFQEAVKWLEKAANEEDAKAMYYLGICYRYGYGIQKDLDKFLYYNKKSAKKGFSKAVALQNYLF